MVILLLVPLAGGLFFLLYKSYQAQIENLNQSKAVTTEFDVPSVNGKLRSFQRAGVEYLVRNKRAFLADDMGLGKTVQAIAAMEYLQSYPVVVVCPATVKFNWLNELKKWIPHRSASLIGSNADVIVMSYGEMAKYKTKAKTVVFDECHYLKNPKSKRTIEAERLAAKSDFVFMLSGTIVVNRARELMSQLKIMRQLHKFGGEDYFIKAFCRKNSDLNQLQQMLRSTCMIRRLKSDVLAELPAKQRSIVEVDIDNRSEYNRVIKNNGIDISSLGQLRQIIADGKMRHGLDWVKDFLETDRKLVVFAHHRDIQRQIYKAIPNAVRITGDMTSEQRQRSVDEFTNNPDCRVIVCSLKAAGFGLNLQVASDVFFFELGWTPAEMFQAEDRCHRMNQRNSVNCYYLIGKDTFDDRMFDLIINKNKDITKLVDSEIKQIFFNNAA